MQGFGIKILTAIFQESLLLKLSLVVITTGYFILVSTHDRHNNMYCIACVCVCVCVLCVYTCVCERVIYFHSDIIIMVIFLLVLINILHINIFVNIIFDVVLANRFKLNQFGVSLCVSCSLSPGKVWLTSLPTVLSQRWYPRGTRGRLSESTWPQTV